MLSTHYFALNGSQSKELPRLQRDKWIVTYTISLANESPWCVVPEANGPKRHHRLDDGQVSTGTISSFQSVLSDRALLSVAFGITKDNGQSMLTGNRLVSKQTTG